MAIPDADLERIHAWCRSKVPEEMQDRVRVEADVTPRHATIVEVHATSGSFEVAPRTSVARLRYTARTGLWSIYWCDSNGNFHLYDRVPTSRKIEPILNFVDLDPDFLFCG